MKPSNKREVIEERFGDMPILFADGFDDAIIGVDVNTFRVCYDVLKCIEILMEQDGMDDIDATDYFYYNVSGAYVGEYTPIWVETDY